jgi:peroxiredoxin
VTEATAASARSPTASPAAPTTRIRMAQVTRAEKLGTTPEGLGVAKGDPIPSGKAMTVDGKEVELRTLLNGKRAMVVFYRGGWCPFCNYQLRQLTRTHKQFEERRVAIVAISVDSPANASQSKTYHGTSLTLLSDSDLSLHRAFNVTNQVDNAAFERLVGKGINLERQSGKQHHTIAVPSIFLVDEKGTVRWRHVDPDFKSRPTPEQLLIAIDETFGGPLAK